jgi:hypothetical protein
VTNYISGTCDELDPELVTTGNCLAFHVSDDAAPVYGKYVCDLCEYGFWFRP